MRKILFLLLLVGPLEPHSLGAQCEPVGAKVFVSGDDTTEVWVNGAYLGAKDYCDSRKGCHPETLFFPIPLAKLPGPQVCLSVKTTNVNPVRVFSSWALEVDCAGGKPFVITNEAKSGISLYWDSTGGANCGVGNSPPVDGKGDIWTDLDYNPASNPFTLTGVPVTSDTYTCAPISNPLSNYVISFFSYDGNAAGAGPNSACGILYWRQVAQLPLWLPTAIPTATFTPTQSFTPIPPPAQVPTLTPTPIPPSPTPITRPRPRATYTPLPISRPVRVIPTPRHISLRPAPTLAWIAPTPTPTIRLRPTWKPAPLPPPRKPTPLPTWLPPPVKDAAIVFQTPPIEVYVTFGDGAGRYQVAVVDGLGRPLRIIFDKDIVGEKDSWVTWDGKDGQGRDTPPGQYFVIFYKDGKALRSISVYRSASSGNP